MLEATRESRPHNFRKPARKLGPSFAQIEATLVAGETAESYSLIGRYS